MAESIPGLRAASLDDVDMVAALETDRLPDEPRDAATVAFWWTHQLAGERRLRLVAERDGAINLFIEAGRDAWNEASGRFGWLQVSLHPRSWSEATFRHGIDTGESWLRSEDAETSVAQVREDVKGELAVYEDLGYRELRRERHWELDLVGRREQLLAAADASRAKMRRLGITLTTLDRAREPDVLGRIYRLNIDAAADIPTTVPVPLPNYDDWLRMYFDNPGIRKDRFWIARAGDSIVGMSHIDYPPGVGIPTTEFTATSPAVRGRGIARALKYETVAQAITLGATRLRTDNDSENAPILHLNAEMGYRPAATYVELHREL